MKAEKEEKIQKIPFKGYYDNLPTEEKLSLRDRLVPNYMQLPTFYQKKDRNGWTALEYEKLKELTGINFATPKDLLP